MASAVVGGSWDDMLQLALYYRCTEYNSFAVSRQLFSLAIKACREVGIATVRDNDAVEEEEEEKEDDE